MMSDRMQINFNLITDDGKNCYLSGKNKGLDARELFNLDELDQSDSIIEVSIEDNIDCNISFLSGLFSKSITNLGSREIFLDKYRFIEIPVKVSEILDDIIIATLSKKTGLSSL